MPQIYPPQHMTFMPLLIFILTMPEASIIERKNPFTLGTCQILYQYWGVET